MIDEKQNQLSAELITCYDYFSQLEKIEEDKDASHLTSSYLKGESNGYLSSDVKQAILNLRDAYVDARGRKTLDDQDVKEYFHKEKTIERYRDINLNNYIKEYQFDKKSESWIKFLGIYATVRDFIFGAILAIAVVAGIIGVPVYFFFTWFKIGFLDCFLQCLCAEGIIVVVAIASAILGGFIRSEKGWGLDDMLKKYDHQKAPILKDKIDALKKGDYDYLKKDKDFMEFVDYDLKRFNYDFYEKDLIEAVDNKYQNALSKYDDYVNKIGPKIKMQLKLIPISYFKQESIYGLVALYMNKRANNITDLINLYETEKFREELVNTISENTSQISSLRKELVSQMSLISSRIEIANDSIGKMHQQLHSDYQELTDQAKMLAIDSNMNSQYKDYLVSVNGETFNVKTYS